MWHLSQASFVIGATLSVTLLSGQHPTASAPQAGPSPSDGNRWMDLAETGRHIAWCRDTYAKLDPYLGETR